MSGHTMTVCWDGYDSPPTYTPRCNEPPEAICRADWDCECEAFSRHGIDEVGPWHELTSGYMTNEELAVERETGVRPRHYGKPGGDCTYVLFLDSNDDIAEAGFGPTTFHIDCSFDDEDVTWSPS